MIRLILFLLISMLSSNAHAFACGPSEPINYNVDKDVKELFEKVHMIAVVEVTYASVLYNGQFGLQYQELKLKPIEQIKGELKVGHEHSFMTPRNGKPPPINMGERYLVLLYKQGNVEATASWPCGHEEFFKLPKNEKLVSRFKKIAKKAKP